MKAILLVPFLWLMAASHVSAQTAEEKAHVALRERTVADLEARRRALPAPIDESAWNREEARAHDALMAQLQQVVGAAPPPKGFSVSRSNPDPLCCAAGAGSLEGWMDAIRSFSITIV